MFKFFKRSALVGAVALTAASSMLLGAAPAQAATETPSFTFASEGSGLNKVINGKSTYSINVKSPFGNAVEVYSLDPSSDYNKSTTAVYHPVARTDTPTAQAAWVAVNSMNVPGALAEAPYEHSAVQLAIWKLATNLDYSSVRSARIVTRANQLVAAAQVLPYSPAMFSLSDRWGSKGILVARVMVDGMPLSSVKVDLTNLSSKKHVMVHVTGPRGKATFRHAPNYSFLTARVGIPAGTVLAPASGPRVITVANVGANIPLATIKPDKYR